MTRTAGRLRARVLWAAVVVSGVVGLAGCTGAPDGTASGASDVLVPPQSVAPAPSLAPVPDDETSIAPRVSESDSAGRLTSVTAVTEGDADVLTFTFADGTVPGYDIRYVDRVERAAGDPVSLRGSAALSATLTNSVPDTTGALGEGVVTNTDYALPVIEQVVLVGNVGGTLTFGVGLTRQAPFTVTTSADSLVVSFAHTSE